MKKEVKIVFAPQKYGANFVGLEDGYKVLVAHQPVLFNDSFVVDINFIDKKIEKNIKNLATVLDVTHKIRSCFDDIFIQNKFPLLIGGDHSVSLGSVSSAIDSFSDISVIWIDAHADMNTDQSTYSGNIHGMVLASLMGYGDKRLTPDINNKFLSKDKTVIFGARDLDDGEEELINTIGVKTVKFSDIEENGLSKMLLNTVQYLKSKTSRIHISLDLDSLDPKVLPAVSVPVNKGFTKQQVFDIIERLFNEFDVVSMDIVEYNPKFDINGITKNYVIDLVKKIKTYVSSKG